MPKISKRTVDAVKPDPDRRVILWDDTLKGFGMLSLPSGVKTYFFNYRNKYGRERRATIGKHGAWTPDQARTRAEALHRAVIDGRDPLEERQSARNALTLGEVFDQYLNSGSFAAKALSTQMIDRGRITRHLRPLLGNVVLKALTVSDVEWAHRAVSDGKTATDIKSDKKRGRIRVTGGKGTARMAIRLLRAILSWAARNRIVTENVAKHVEIGRDGRRSVIIDDAATYGRLFRTLDNMETKGKIRPEVADAIRLIALTGARRGEVTGLKWRHVDLRSGTLTLRATEHKSGRATGDDRVIGLPALAVAIIDRQKRRDSDYYVFTTAQGNNRVDLSKPWQSVRSEAELPDKLGLHGLRHSLATHMAMEGAAAPEIQQMLGHRDITTSSRYVHWAKDQRQVLAEKAASKVSEALSAVSGNSTPLKLKSSRPDDK